MTPMWGSQANDIPQKPYNCLATFVTDPAMYRNDNGVEFLNGFSKGLGTDVTFHYRKGNQSTGRDGAYLVQWLETPFGRERRQNRVFPNILETELFLRADDRDLTWIDEIGPEVLTLIEKALNAEQSPLSIEDTLVAKELAALYSPDNRNLCPERFKVPYAYRTALSALLANAVNSYHRVAGVDVDLLGMIKEKIDLAQQIDNEDFKPFP
jgi:hypothetical protein